LEEQALPFSPNLIITHQRGDLNVDHRIVHDAVMTCFRPLPGCQPCTILAMAVPSSTGWAAPEARNAFLPNAFSDISETLEVKVAAMQAYRTERAEWPTPLAGGVARCGSTLGQPGRFACAESFMLLRGFL
jgi:LmbE family N-acetylglucosaminyl deacetylase